MEKMLWPVSKARELGGCVGMSIAMIGISLGMVLGLQAVGNVFSDLGRAVDGLPRPGITSPSRVPSSPITDLSEVKGTRPTRTPLLYATPTLPFPSTR